MDGKYFNSRKFLMVLWGLIAICIGGCNYLEVNDPIKSTLTKYLEFVKNNDYEKAYNLLDESSLPDKDNFIKSIQYAQLESYEIIESKEVSSELYWIRTNLTFDGLTSEIVFTIAKDSSGEWKVRLNTDPEQDNFNF